MTAAVKYGRIGRHVSRTAWARPRPAFMKAWQTRSRFKSSTASTSPPLIYPEQPRSVKHNDLPSFLRYAERAGVDTGSTTFVGTFYEYTVADHLAPLGFSLRRVGGASDRGIDLLGTWTLPIPKNSPEASPEPLRAIVQCKAGAGQRVGPHLVRELEGAFIGAPVGWRSRVGNGDGETAENSSSNNSNNGSGSPAVIGVLVTEKAATKGIRDALARSRWPMAYIYCAGEGHVRQMLWNQQAEKTCGLVGLGVTLRHAVDEHTGAYTRIVLTWQGKPLSAVPLQSS